MQLAVDSAMYFFRLLLNARRPVSAVSQWLVKFVSLVRYKQRAENSRAIITNMVFGVENPKNNDIRLAFI
jgi:hypothetical protein